MKRLFLFTIALCTVCLLSIHAFAGTCFIGYLGGNNEYDGKSAINPKKQFLGLYDEGAMSVVGQNGGTLVIVDRAYIGANYTFPEMRGTLTITGKYGEKSYVDAGNVVNPTGGMLKAASDKILTLGTDTVLTDMILFQESGQNTIIVPSYVTLTITDTVEIMTKPGNDYYFKIYLCENATAVLSEEALDKLDIVNRGGTVKLYDDGKAKIINTSLKMTVGSKSAYINQVQKELDAAPIIRNSRTMLPVRFIAEACGATVEWNGGTSTATVTSYDGNVIEITIGKSRAKINNVFYPIDAPAFIENGRTYLPVRFIAESLGATVLWDAATSTATIDHTLDRTPKVDLTKFATPTDHSDYYLDGLTPDELVNFFNEVCISSDRKVNDNPIYLIFKWETPIYYMALGDYTSDDLEALDSFAEYLNTVDGFPGMYRAKGQWGSTLTIYFGDHTKMVSIMGENAEGCDGFVKVNLNSSMEITQGKICVLSTLEQSYRNAVIRHEVFNGLGLMNDSATREDSLIYNFGLKTDNLSEEDEVILQMLYSKKIKAGMNEKQCEYIIRELYY